MKNEQILQLYIGQNAIMTSRAHLTSTGLPFLMMTLICSNKYVDTEITSVCTGNNIHACL